MHFVLSGGGLKGFALIGFMKALEENNIKPTGISGSSIGAIFAVLISIGYSYNELYDFIEHFNYEDFSEINITSLFDDGGLETGNKIIRLLKLMIKNKLNSPNVTFLEHYEKTKVWVVINSVCVNKQQTEYFSYKTHPNMYIHTALRMSISLPFWFKPVMWNDCYYVDGGLLDNFPIKPFIDSEIPKHEIVGIKLQTHNLYGTKVDITQNLMNYSLSLWNCIYNEINKKCIIEHENNGYNIWYIISTNLSAFSVDIKKEEKIKLFEDAYENSTIYLKKYIENEIQYVIEKMCSTLSCT